MPLKCNLCDKEYSTQFNLNKHCRLKHNIKRHLKNKSCTSGNFKCLDCEECSFPRSSDLIEHLRSEHNQDIVEEVLEFKNLGEFQTWKYAVERKEHCSYVVFSGKKCLNSKKEIQYYTCNRSWLAYGKQKNIENIAERKRNFKTQGSAKLAYKCISTMKLINKSTKFVVHRIINHYGHTTDLQHVRISHQDKQELVSKLMSGVSKSRILEEQRNKINGELKRIDLLTAQDLNNLKKSYKIEFISEPKHHYEAINIERWIEECESLKSNPILFYKPRKTIHKDFENDDYCLIIMNNLQESLLNKFGSNVIAVDSTLYLTHYEFELVTLMVIDELNESFPVAFMFSNPNNSFIYKKFFETIKLKTGTIRCKTFMSDMSGSIYDAWTQTMGQSTYQLYSPWYIDRLWQKNLHKIKDKEKRLEVYNNLKHLQKSIEYSDVNMFEKELRTTTTDLVNDCDTEAFGDYFSKNFSNNSFKWALFLHKTCGLNSDTRLESVHKVVNYFYFFKSFKTFEKGVYATLKFTRDKTVNRLLKFTKGKWNGKSLESFKTHRSALTSKFISQAQSSGGWCITHRDNQFFVQKTNIAQKCCKSVCEFCKICVHQYTCSCPNYCDKTVICQHIHFVASNNKSDISDGNLVQPFSSNGIKEEEEEDDLSVSDFSDVLSENGYDLKEELLQDSLQDLETLIDNTDLEQMSDNILEEAVAKLDSTNYLFDFCKK